MGVSRIRVVMLMMSLPLAPATGLRASGIASISAFGLGILRLIGLFMGVMRRIIYPGQFLVRLLQKRFIERGIAEVGALEHGLLRAAALCARGKRFRILASFNSKSDSGPEACSAP